MALMNKLDGYLNAYQMESIDELSTLVAQPSVSAHQQGLMECSKIIVEMLKKRSFEVQIFSNDVAPIIVAERKGKSDKTLLFYNHYDVQPAEPLDLWLSPPFEPIIRDGKLFGRGSSDNKGNITNRLFALDAFLTEEGELPCNIKFLLEGEEEVSSKHLEEFVSEHADLIQADACIVEFGGVDHTDIPVEYLGLRGICYVQLDVETANQDVHSGLGGSIFPNAAWRLVWALNLLKDQDEHICIPGFYEKVRKPSQRDRELMRKLPETANDYKTRYEIKIFLKGLTGGVDLRLAEVFEPTCTICGITSGYQGPGLKTVLPAKASAKIDFRLVPDQKPEDVLNQLRDYLDVNGFNDVTITYLGGEAPARTDPDDTFIQLVVDSATEVYGKPMQIMPMTGGSGPNYIVQQALQIPIATLGVGYPEGNAYAPNENIRLNDYIKAARHLVRVLDAFGRV